MSKYINCKSANSSGHICIRKCSCLNWRDSLRHCAVCLSHGIPGTATFAVWSDESVQENIHACVKGIPASATQQMQSGASLTFEQPLLLFTQSVTRDVMSIDSSFAVLLWWGTHTYAQVFFLKRSYCSKFYLSLSMKNSSIEKTILFLDPRNLLHPKFCPYSKSRI